MSVILKMHVLYKPAIWVMVRSREILVYRHEKKNRRVFTESVVLKLKNQKQPNHFSVGE